MPHTHLIKHPYVLAGVGAGLAVAFMSAGYYALSTRAPGTVALPAQTAQGDIVAQGTVTALQNPELAFAIGGRVTSVSARVGQRALAGQVLASLDTGTLAANLSGAAAKLRELQSGPLSTDLSAAQTGVAQAQAGLTSLYEALPASVLDAQAKAQSAVYVTIAPLVGHQGNQGQLFTFNSGNSQNDIRVGQEYDQVELILEGWSGAQANLDQTPPAQKEAALQDTLTKLRSVRALLVDLSTLLVDANESTFGEGMTVSQARADVLSASASVNTSIGALTSAQSALASAKLSLDSAQTNLQKVVNGARAEDIQVQEALVESAAAALRQAEIIAPFAGTVGSVAIKQGDVVVANTQAVSLLPDSAAQVDIYVSEIDVTKVSVGEGAQITLDAYGSGRAFAGTVSAVDAAPSPSGPGGAIGYKVTVTFNQKDPAVAVGMHANVTLHAR